MGPRLTARILFLEKGDGKRGEGERKARSASASKLIKSYLEGRRGGGRKKKKGREKSVVPVAH